MSDIERYIVEVIKKDDGETNVSMKPIKKKMCRCCLCDFIISTLPYIVIGILGCCALFKIDGCLPVATDRIVTTSNEILRVEFNCVHCNCKKVDKSDGR